MIDTLFLDFDGVIRHWSGSEISDAEQKLNVKCGVLFAVAFESALLNAVITGEISHEVWLERIQQALVPQCGIDAAAELITAWQSASYTIDYDFLSRVRQLAGDAKLVLVTNATSELPYDLARCELSEAFDLVINSSVIGIAKPDARFYAAALAQAATNPESCLFIDDSLENVEMACSLGIAGLHHIDTDETLRFIETQCASPVC